MNLANVIERNQQHSTFEIPSKEELSALKVSDFVKVVMEDLNQGGERPWVKVTAIDGEDITGELANDLVVFDIPFGTELKLHFKNVAGIFTA